MGCSFFCCVKFHQVSTVKRRCSFIAATLDKILKTILVYIRAFSQNLNVSQANKSIEKKIFLFMNFYFYLLIFELSVLIKKMAKEA
jgi:hypothetical protein